MGVRSNAGRWRRHVSRHHLALGAHAVAEAHHATRERIAHMEWERGGLSLLVTERVLEDGSTKSLRQLHQSLEGVVVSDVAELEAALKCGKFV
jgi:hypothetical protein